MATLEDKILGEKLNNYCSSSESDGDDSDESGDEEKSMPKQESDPATLPEANKWEGTSTNTGPKGVIKDWQRFKQLETEKRTEQERERLDLLKKLTLTVQSALDEEREKVAEDDPEFAELMNDEFLLAYQKQRMHEMLQQSQHNLKFGKVLNLSNGGDFLDAIDKENKTVTVVIHIYEENVEACIAMNSCFQELSKRYLSVKFCTIVGSQAGMSKHFKISGVPALLIYKAGNLVGTFVRITDDLGNDFDYEDVEGFLTEHGFLHDKNCVPYIIKQSDTNDDSD